MKKLEHNKIVYWLKMAFAIATVISAWVGAIMELYFHVFRL